MTRVVQIIVLALTVCGLRAIEAAEGDAKFAKLPTEAWSAVIPAEKNLPPQWEKALFERGEPRTYEGDALMKIGMPVGGVCAGFVYLGGDGKLWWWDIFNRILSGVQPRQIQYKDRSWHGMAKGLGAWQGGNYIEPVTTQPSPMQQGFVLKITAGGKTQVRTLDRKGWKKVSFTGCYPVGVVRYADPQCPVTVTLEAFSPYCPLNFDDSSYPATIMRYSLENTTKEDVKVEVGGWLENAVLLDSGKNCPGVSRVNTVTSQQGLTMLCCSASLPPDGPKTQEQNKATKTKPDWGTMALAALGTSAGSGSAQLGASPEQAVFAAGGPAQASAPIGTPLLGGVTQSLTLAAGKTGTATFVISWHFVNLKEHASGIETGWYYGKRFGDAAAVARHIAANEKRLSEATLLWRDTWHDSTLPFWFLDRIFTPLDCLASTTCFRLGNGRFYTYEGVRSCPGHPNHVWHYAQGHARVFPELEQDVIERVWYGSGFHEDGSLAYRGEIAGNSAIDGHCGVILSVLRAHQMNPDAAMLKRVWPRVKKSIEYAMARDRDNDGLLDTPMLTTLDEPWHGQIPWISSLYIAALKAGEQMAAEMGDADFATNCRARAEKGRAAMDARLFNGEWFVQRPDPANPKKLGAYETCHIDQVMGQGWAWQVGLGRVLNEATTRSALNSLWKYNFARNLDAYDKQADPKGRPYYADGEGGLVMTANALGRKVPFGIHSGYACYLNETMNGFEYQAAAHMIAEGLVKEGLAVIRTLDERYDGNKRNPFNEVECGDHYARSMASYGALVAISGFEYHGPKRHIGFAPRLTPENFKAPFTAAEGWGTFSQSVKNKELAARIEIKHGRLNVKSFGLMPPKGSEPHSAKVAVNGKATGCKLEVKEGKAVVTLDADMVVNPGESLDIVIN